MFDTDVIVIDPEKEYEYLAEATGGRYFNISLNSEHHINPFDLPVPRDDESPADVLRSNIITLTGLFRIMLGDYAGRGFNHGPCHYRNLRLERHYARFGFFKHYPALDVRL